MKLYSVSDWNDHYENNRSRLVKELAWVPVPNGHDGENYSRLITGKNAAEIFAAWILILQVASRCTPRGTLTRSNGSPHDPASLSLKTRAPATWFEKSLPALIECGWLYCKQLTDNDTAPACRSSAASTSQPCQRGDEEGKGREQNGRELAASPTPRARDPIFDTLCLIEGSDPLQIGAGGSRIGKCLKQIRQSTPDVTADEIKRRARNWPFQFPDATLTADALAKWWSKCGFMSAPANQPRLGANL